MSNQKLVIYRIAIVGYVVIEMKQVNVANQHKKEFLCYNE